MKKLIICFLLIKFLCAEDLPDTTNAGNIAEDELPVPPFCGVSGVSISNGRLLNGNRVAPDEFTWTARLSTSTHRFMCTGSLITPRWVLTAAQCKGLKGLKYVEFGSSLQLLKKVLIERTIVNRWNSIFEHSFDVALVRLASPVSYSIFLQPICLPINSIDIKANMSAIVAGWGRYMEGYPSNHLRKSTMRIVSFPQCFKEWKNYAPKASLNETQHFCAGDQKSSACSGDAGAPLMLKLPKSRYFYQIGLLTFGREYCTMEFGGLPTVFQNVHEHIEWIVDTIKKYK